MDAATIETTVIGIVAKQFATSKEKVTKATFLEADLGADSLDTVELVMDLEDGLGIQIPDDGFTTIKTVGDVIVYVEAICVAHKAKQDAKPSPN